MGVQWLPFVIGGKLHGSNPGKRIDHYSMLLLMCNCRARDRWRVSNPRCEDWPVRIATGQAGGNMPQVRQ